MKKCPVCNSTRISENHLGAKCRKCGFEQKKSKIDAAFEKYEFDNSLGLYEINKKRV